MGESRIWPSRRKRQNDCHRGSLPLSFAMRGYCTAVQLGNVLHNVEAKTKSAMLSRRGCVSLLELLKHEWKEVRTNAFSGVRHVYVKLVADAAEIDFYFTTRIREFQCIAQQVIDNLLETIGVGED